MIVHFLFCDNFPEGSAYANRIHTLSKGLVEYGDSVEVAVVYPGRKKSVSQEQQRVGKIDSIRYKQYCLFRFKPQRRFLQIVDGFFGILHYGLTVIFISAKKKPQVIISGSSSFLHLIVLRCVGALRGIKILREKNEYPKFKIQQRTYFAYRSRYKLLDGFVFMTDALKHYFEENLKISKPSCIVRMTVDVDRFNDIIGKDHNHEELLLTLIGDIMGEKDGVGLLINGFNIVLERFPSAKLVLVGDISNTELYNTRLEKLRELGIEQSVIFTGIKHKDEIPELLYRSRLLLLSRPSSIQAEGGFPTKLGEYLASGIPTVITKTGEIPNYLTDEVNSFLVEPDSAELFAKRIIFALENKNMANEVGCKGKELANNTFSYKVQGRVLHEFLLSMV